MTPFRGMATTSTSEDMNLRRDELHVEPASRRDLDGGVGPSMRRPADRFDAAATFSKEAALPEFARVRARLLWMTAAGRSASCVRAESAASEPAPRDGSPGRPRDC